MTTYGTRLMPQALDSLASRTPSRTYACIATDPDVSRGFLEVSCQDMARCVDFMAHYIVEHFGSCPYPTDPETLAYIGTPDLRSAAVFLGAVKAGYKVLLPSPRNPAAMNVSLMQQTSCTKLLYAIEVTPVINGIVNCSPTIWVKEIGSFQEMLHSNPKHYPYDYDFATVKDRPVVILHSSGSTGTPKPIAMTHATFATLDNERNLPKTPGRRNRDYSVWDFEGRFYTVYPYFHLAGFLCLTVNPIFTEASSPVLGPPLMPPSGSLLKQIMRSQKLRALYLPPSICEQLLAEPNGIDFFKGLDFLCYTGAPFSPAAGAKLSTVTELCPLYGSTETFQVPQLAPRAPAEDWAWMEWNPHVKLEMRPYMDEDATYELVLFADSTTTKTSALNHNLPGVTEYPTKDLFRKHPAKPGLWQYSGRRDDIIVLSNGEKFNPVPLELMVQGHPRVTSALVFVMGKTQSALLVEVESSLRVDEKDNFVESLWPIIKDANQLLPSQGRIMRDMIILSNPEKPFARAGKGSVIRKMTYQLYQKEIDDIYTAMDVASSDAALTDDRAISHAFTIEQVTATVHDIVVETVSDAIELDPEDNLFSIGLDSLKSTHLLKRLKDFADWASGRKDTSWLNVRIVYQHPSIKELATLLYGFISTGKILDTASRQSRRVKMQALVDKYSRDLPITPKRTKGDRKSMTIAVIGTTGYLGPHILAKLLEGTEASTIYCLNRGVDAEKRTLSALERHPGALQQATTKLRFRKIELGTNRFGLYQVRYSELVSEVDVIIFNSWHPNFSLPLEAFEKPFLQAIRTATDWAIVSPRQPRITFISSIAAVGNWSTVHPLDPVIPEEAAMNSDIAMEMGYGESKCVAEQLLVRANDIRNVPVSIVRAGQIGGPSIPTQGPWPEQAWLLSLIKSAKVLGVLPTKVASVDWIPVNTLAAGISNVALNVDQHDELSLRVFNMVHPRPRPWKVCMDAIERSLHVSAKEETLPKWLDRLEQAAEGSSIDAANLQAMEIQPFLRSLGEGREDLTRCHTSNAESMLGDVAQLSDALIADWFSSWKIED
ncbi:acetyl-CoA synthetase-like protein [Lophiostoma macrostomum CBS 122681]|uniref:Acetyl-CoA synthetase-like protein n=1 Tax=Lophiostoma macrostomum CBS 122681 TaxID=1314788 RepID=A0A6A6SW61_9PLEO|nr:acetyl-CoA synthetase-like protein [Lophiostoma macrostomum CBS 122681]